jgi:hypothetical protein
MVRPPYSFDPNRWYAYQTVMGGYTVYVVKFVSALIRYAVPPARMQHMKYREGWPKATDFGRRYIDGFRRCIPSHFEVGDRDEKLLPLLRTCRRMLVKQIPILCLISCRPTPQFSSLTNYPVDIRKPLTCFTATTTSASFTMATFSHSTALSSHSAPTRSAV